MVKEVNPIKLFSLLTPSSLIFHWGGREGCSETLKKEKVNQVLILHLNGGREGRDEHTLVISLMTQSGYKCLKEEGGGGGCRV